MTKRSAYNEMLVVGNGQEIKAIYKSLIRHPESGWYPLYLDAPKFAERRTYGIKFDSEEMMFCIIGERTLAAMVADGDL